MKIEVLGFWLVQDMIKTILYQLETRELYFHSFSSPWGHYRLPYYHMANVGKLACFLNLWESAVIQMTGWIASYGGGCITPSCWFSL